MPILIEELEATNDLFMLAVMGLDDVLKNNELSRDDVDKLISALQVIEYRYKDITKKMNEVTE